MSNSRHDVSFVRTALGLTLVLSFSATSAAQVKPTQRSVPQVDGFWEGPYDWPHNSVHTALLPTGNVASFAYGASALDVLWTEFDPFHYAGTGGFLAKSLFCGGHVLFADGRLLVAGGTLSDPDSGHVKGPTHTEFYSPWTHAWSAGDDMNHGRFYPTLVTLGDGRVLALSGINELGEYEPTSEIYDDVLGWNEIAGADLVQDLYPRAHLTTSGAVFVAGPGPVSTLLDPVAPAWYPIATTQASYRAEGCSVLLPGAPDRVLLIGGTSDGASGDASCERIDLHAAHPQWEPAAPMEFPRFHHNALFLADGSVLVFGGAEFDDPAATVYPCEIYSPNADHWRTVASVKRPRLYHSSGVLLPDGRVLVGGGDGEATIEIYWPPYMFRPRPEVEVSPGTLQYGTAFTLDLVHVAASDIGRVALIRPVATTHSVAMDQRYVDLTFGVSGDRQLVVDAPTNPNAAPLGFYMLVVVDRHGTPSVATMVYLV
ncbi:MAG: DUF1929 domain-containing protein [Planctomycetes bacterium]|nr:DUF1929 domain-containing protein [Planctomycetota bacterium]